MHGLLRCNINTGVHARSGRADVSLRWETELHSANGHAPEARGGFGEIFKKSVSRVETWHRTRRLTFACSRRPWAGVARDAGGGESRWKSQDRKIVSLSPYVEKPLNSKVIKSFVPEPRSRKCFSCFESPMFYVIYIYEHYMSISRIVVSGDGTTRPHPLYELPYHILSMDYPTTFSQWPTLLKTYHLSNEHKLKKYL